MHFTDIKPIAFGHKISWIDDTHIPPEHSLSFKDALNQVSAGVTWRLILPNWAMAFTPRLRRIMVAFNELEVCAASSRDVLAQIIPGSNTCWK